MISGLPPKYSLRNDVLDKNIVEEPFIFALNDQELEYQKVSDTIILATKVTKEDWIQV